MAGRAWGVGASVLSVLLVAGPAMGLPIAIDPGNYRGQYAAGNAWHTGPAVVDLPVGASSIYVGGAGPFTVTVAADGTVLSQNQAAAVGGASSVGFNTTPVQFDVGLYRGQFSLNNATTSLTGSRSIDLPPGLRYWLFIGGGGPAGYVDVAGDGTVTTTNAAALATSAATVHFNTLPVQFDVGLYRGQFALNNATAWLSGSQSVDLPPGIRYWLFIGGAGPAGYVDVAGDGTVTATNTTALSVAGLTVHFNTSPVHFEVGIYRGSFALNNASAWLNGSQSIELPLGVRYWLHIGAGDGAGYLDVAADGTVAATNPVAVQTNAATATFRTIGVRLDPGAATGRYGLNNVTTWVTGPLTLGLVQGVRYYTATESPFVSGYFSVGELCAIAPSQLVLGALTLSITCAARPTAVAGADQNVPESSVVALDGSASTGDGLHWQWTQIAGPAVSLANAQASTATFTAPSLAGGFGSQVLTFALTVSNALGSSTSNLNVTVSNVNHAPVAHATAPALVNEGSAVLLDGTATWDPDGDPVTYLWEQAAGPSVAASATTPTLSFNAPLLTGGQGGAVTLQFRLTVFDGAISSMDLVSIQVEQVNHAPVAVAGVGRAVSVGMPVTLDGTASSDADGDWLLSQWSQVSGPMVVLTGATTAQASFTPPTAGVYVFSLVVSDGLLSSAASLVTISVTQPDLPPDCSHAVASPAVLWPPNHKLIPVQVLGVTDPVHSPVSITITGVQQDEATGGLDQDDTSPDAVIRGSIVLLRAEREEHGDGRVYLISFRATDALGNVCTGTVSSTVPTSRKPQQESRDSGERHDSTH